MSSLVHKKRLNFVMKAVDWVGHSYRERVFCCINMLHWEGLLTVSEQERIRKRAMKKLNENGL